MRKIKKVIKKENETIETISIRNERSANAKANIHVFIVYKKKSLGYMTKLNDRFYIAALLSGRWGVCFSFSMTIMSICAIHRLIRTVNFHSHFRQ